MSQIDMSGSAGVPQPIPMPNQGLQGESYSAQATPESSVRNVHSASELS